MNRQSYCQDCPHRQAEDAFKLDYEELVFEMLATRKYRFDELQSALFRVINLEDLPKAKMTVKTGALISVYLREKSRFDRIQQLEREREANK